MRCRLHPNKAFGFEAQLQEKRTVTLAEDSFLAEAFQEGSSERGQSTIGSPIMPGPAGLSPSTLKGALECEIEFILA